MSLAVRFKILKSKKRNLKKNVSCIQSSSTDLTQFRQALLTIILTIGFITVQGCLQSQTVLQRFSKCLKADVDFILTFKYLSICLTIFLEETKEYSKITPWYALHSSFFLDGRNYCKKKIHIRVRRDHVAQILRVLLAAILNVSKCTMDIALNDLSRTFIST